MDKNIAFEIEYNKLLDILRISEKKCDPKKAAFYQFEKFPIYLIAENNLICGIEYFEYKKNVKNFYASKKKELGLKSIKEADEFLKGNLYSFYKTEFCGGKIIKLANRKIEVENKYTQKKMLRNIEDLVAA